MIDGGQGKVDGGEVKADGPQERSAGGQGRTDSPLMVHREGLMMDR
jgi:hypothetical protein